MKKLIALIALVVAPSLHAQQLPDSGTFFVRLGRDTVAVERYTHYKNQLIAEALLRTPVTRRIKLTITFKNDGSLSWWEIINQPVAGTGDTGPVTRILVTLIGDSAQVDFTVGATPRLSRKIAANRALMPIQLPFYSTYEIALQRARANPSDTVFSMMAANAPLHYRISRPRPDSILLFHPQSGTTVFKMDGNGRLLRMNAEGTTFKVVVTRSRPVSLEPWQARFAKADSTGKSIGFLSPRDSAAAAFDHGSVSIDYSRPSKRGRVIFGGIVPWDSVWRTGANAATGIHVEGGAMMIGNVRIPAGKYTLWTLPSKRGWKLIINKQTNQWGTVYDPNQDLVRIDVRSENIPVPMEQFTIGVTRRTGSDGTLALTWDRTRVVVPFRMVQ